MAQFRNLSKVGAWTGSSASRAFALSGSTLWELVGAGEEESPGRLDWREAHRIQPPASALALAAVLDRSHCTEVCALGSREVRRADGGGGGLQVYMVNGQWGTVDIVSLGRGEERQVWGLRRVELPASIPRPLPPAALPQLVSTLTFQSSRRPRP